MPSYTWYSTEYRGLRWRNHYVIAWRRDGKLGLWFWRPVPGVLMKAQAYGRVALAEPGKPVVWAAARGTTDPTPPEQIQE